MPKAMGRVALDSGAFTELKDYGRFRTSRTEYVAEVRRWQSELGPFDFVCIQDWMCEPVVISGGKLGPLTFVGTKLSVEEHQWRTVQSYLALRSLAPEIKWLPTLQGYTLREYENCIELYARNGVDLMSEERVGLGSVCRRQGTREIAEIVYALAKRGLKLHGFGVKVAALKDPYVRDNLVSADSMAWSLDARRTRPLPGHTHKSCANCLEYALIWRQSVLDAGKPPSNPYQLSLEVA